MLAQQQLDNEAIVKLHKAGLGEDMIVNMVNTQPGQYAVGVNDVVALKQAGISEKIIAAMMSKGNAPAVSPAAPPPRRRRPRPPLPEAEIGVYYKKGDQWEEVLPEVVNWKTGGVLKTVATVGRGQRGHRRQAAGPSSKNKCRPRSSS